MSTARLIDEAYVKNGQVRIVLKNMPVHGEPASQAAQAVLCAADQGKHWEFHDRLMESFYVGNRAIFNPAGLKQVAADLGLEPTAFAACLDSAKYAKRVQDEAAEAKIKGVTGTPTFFVNDTKIVGAKSFASFQQAIDAALEAN